MPHLHGDDRQCQPVFGVPDQLAHPILGVRVAQPCALRRVPNAMRLARENEAPHALSPPPS